MGLRVLKFMAKPFRVFMVFELLIFMFPLYAINLTGTLINQKQEPISGCEVSLQIAKQFDSTVNGAFEINVVSVENTRGRQGSSMAGQGISYILETSNNVNIDLFGLDGSLLLNLSRGWKDAGQHFLGASILSKKLRENKKGKGPYLLRLKTSTYLYTYKITILDDFLFSVPVRVSDKKPLAKKSGLPLDSLLIQCYGYSDYRIPITDYNQSLGVIKLLQPNIIFIMADDLGYGDVGFNGNTVIKTPNLDIMASNGIRFTRFYSIGPVCAPTRASFLTGRHYLRFGMTNVNIGKLPSQEITLARIAKSKGYTTGHFGKWHLGALKAGVSPVRTGVNLQAAAPPWERDYDESFVSEINLATWNPMDYTGLGNKHQDSFWVNGEIETQNLQGSTSRIIMDRVIPFINKAVQDSQPFLTTIWFHAPHSPVRAGPQYLDMYPGYSLGAQHYYGCITALDEQVGRLRTELASLGITNNTLIWFTSDNGPEGNGNPGPDYNPYGGADYGVTGGFRGRKRSLYNGGVCVPSFMNWPGKITAAQTVEMPSAIYDYVPTITDLLGYNYSDNRPIDGTSLIPLIIDGISIRTKSMPFASTLNYQPTSALIKGQYKFTTHFSVTQTEDALYHIYDDPSESNNIINLFQATADTMKNELINWVTSSRQSFENGDYPEPYLQQGRFFTPWPLPEYQ